MAEAGSSDQVLPPADLYRRRLPLVRLAGPWARIHRKEHDPLFFGATGRNRFDDPLGRFGVLYAAQEPAGAFIEVFGFGVVGGVNTVRESETLGPRICFDRGCTTDAPGGSDRARSCPDRGNQ